jgi:hypothetical protein
VRGRWSVKKNTGHAGSGRCGGGCPSGGRAASVPRGVGPPAKRTSRGDGCVSYGGALSHAGGSLATRRGGGVSSFGTAHGGAGGARKCGRTMKSQGGLGRLARGEARRCSRSKAYCTNDGGPTCVGDRSDGRMCPAGPVWGRIRWRVTIATSRFSRTNEASIRSTPRGTGPRPWLLDRRRPAGRQRPQVREKYPAP